MRQYETKIVLLREVNPVPRLEHGQRIPLNHYTVMHLSTFCGLRFINAVGVAGFATSNKFVVASLYLPPRYPDLPPSWYAYWLEQDTFHPALDLSILLCASVVVTPNGLSHIDVI